MAIAASCLDILSRGVRKLKEGIMFVMWIVTGLRFRWRVRLRAYLLVLMLVLETCSYIQAGHAGHVCEWRALSNH